MDLINKYIADQKPEHQEALEQVRQAIVAGLPQFTTTLAYQMPTYRDRKNLIHFAAQSKHIGIYPAAAAIEYFKDQLQDYALSKGTIKIPYDQLVPRHLLTQIAAWTYDHNQ